MIEPKDLVLEPILYNAKWELPKKREVYAPGKALPDEIDYVETYYLYVTGKKVYLYCYNSYENAYRYETLPVSMIGCVSTSLFQKRDPFGVNCCSRDEAHRVALSLRFPPTSEGVATAEKVYVAITSVIS